MKVEFICPFAVHSGYARAAHDTAMALAAAGIDLSITPIHDCNTDDLEPRYGGLIEYVRRFDDPTHIIVMTIPRFAFSFVSDDLAPGPGVRRICYTTWETTHLPKEDAATLAKYFDWVLVPSQFSADGIAAGGFPRERIKVIPYGYDPRFWLLEDEDADVRVVAGEEGDPEISPSILSQEPEANPASRERVSKSQPSEDFCLQSKTGSEEGSQTPVQKQVSNGPGLSSETSKGRQTVLQEESREAIGLPTQISNGVRRSDTCTKKDVLPEEPRQVSRDSFEDTLRHHISRPPSAREISAQQMRDMQTTKTSSNRPLSQDRVGAGPSVQHLQHGNRKLEGQRQILASRHQISSAPTRPYRFVNVGLWNARKAPIQLLLAYITTFSSQDDVLLTIVAQDVIDEDVEHLAKCSGLDDLPPVEFIRTRLSEVELRQLHYQSDCYVLLPRGEAWALGAFEACLVGNPVISVKFGGQTDYLDDYAGTLYVNYTLTPAITPEVKAGNPITIGSVTYTPMKRAVPTGIAGDQNWAEPDIWDAKRKMRYAYENRLRRNDYLGTSLLPERTKFAEKYSYQAVGQKWREFLEAI